MLSKKRLTFIFLCCGAVLLGLALPGKAFAWGPGVHMVTGNWVLQNLTALPPALAAALMLYPAAYLRGTLSPDIFIGKGSRPKPGHSHNWKSGFALLGKARYQQEVAYACGYLSHLAADVVAHNLFVPGLFHTVPGSGKVAHVYLEAQADRLLLWDSADAVRVLHGKGSRGNDAALRSTLQQRGFSFWIKKRIFQGSVALGGNKTWRSSMRLVDYVLPCPGRGPILEHMMKLCTRAIVNLLCEQQRSALLDLDPIGAEILARAGDALHVKKSSAPEKLFGQPGLATQKITGGTAGGTDAFVLSVLENFPSLCTSDSVIPK